MREHASLLRCEVGLVIGMHVHTAIEGAFSERGSSTKQVTFFMDLAFIRLKSWHGPFLRDELLQLVNADRSLFHLAYF